METPSEIRERALRSHTKALVVDDEPTARLICLEVVKACGYEALEATSCAEAERLCREQRPHVAILDYQLGDGDALGLMLRLHEVDPALAVIVLTAHGSIELAVEAMRRGANHFLSKPVEPEVLAVILDRSLKEGRQHRQRMAYNTNRKRHAPNPFEGQSPALSELERMAHRVAEGNGPVLLSGETGCGKGVLARWLHENGARSGEPFIELNCAGLKPEFLESELFGYKKGAFTGASQSKPGLLQVADRGTLFLDEIGDMDLGIQAKLLKVLEDLTFRPLGEVEDRRVDVRLIAATHRDLASMVQAEQFRADLYFRIHALRLDIPPLRARRGDLPGLVSRLLAELGQKSGRPHLGITPRALESLQRYPWPGNIRELRNSLERAILMGDGETLDTADFYFEEGFYEKPLGHELEDRQDAGIPRAVLDGRASEIGHRSVKGPGSIAAPRSGSGGKVSMAASRPADHPEDRNPAEPRSAPGLWEALGIELRRWIEASRTVEEAPPLGLWLEEDLILKAMAEAGGVQRQAAFLLGIPCSTFSRRLQRARSGDGQRPAGWESVATVADQLLRVSHPPESDLTKEVGKVLLQAIQASGVKTGPALLGVSAPTFRRRQKILDHSPTGPHR